MKQEADLKIPFALPNISEKEIIGVVEVLRSGWLTTGKKAEELEHLVSEFVGGGQVSAVSSATMGLVLALKSFELPEGSWVIVPDVTFTASARAIELAGLVPIIVDVDNHGLLDLDLVDALLSKILVGKVSAIMPVHYAGMVVDMVRVKEIAKKYNLAIVEDAAHAFGSSVNGIVVGSGVVGCHSVVYSLYATKCITSAEGGLVVSGTEEYKTKIDRLRLHGIDKNAVYRYKTGVIKYDVVDEGFKANMPDILAGLAIAQLKRESWLRACRTVIASRYEEGLAGLEIAPVFRVNTSICTGIQSSWHLYPVRVPGNKQSLFAKHLIDHEVGVSMHFVPLHQMTYWQKKAVLFPRGYPQADRFASEEISLPIYAGLTKAQVQRVIEVVGDFRC
jgi:dTDP-4-amino-4,6-dideoxygalactose transaminase